MLREELKTSLEITPHSEVNCLVIVAGGATRILADYIGHFLRVELRESRCQ